MSHSSDMQQKDANLSQILAVCGEAFERAAPSFTAEEFRLAYRGAALTIDSYYRNGGFQPLLERVPGDGSVQLLFGLAQHMLSDTPLELSALLIQIFSVAAAAPLVQPEFKSAPPPAPLAQGDIDTLRDAVGAMGVCKHIKAIAAEMQALHEEDLARLAKAQAAFETDRALREASQKLFDQWSAPVSASVAARSE